MKNSTGPTTEYTAELNPQEAHITIRANSRPQLEELIKRLYPVTYVKETPEGTYIHLAENETDNNRALGVITKVCVPGGWVANRRVDFQQQQQQKVA